MFEWDGIRNKYIEQQREKPVSNEVKVYWLSSEELEKYRAKEGERSMTSENGQEITKEKYLELKEKGISDRLISQRYGIHQSKLSLMKKDWGLEGMRVNNQTEEGQETQRKSGTNIVAELEKQIIELRQKADRYQEEVKRVQLEKEQLEKRYEKVKRALRALL